MFPLIVGAWSSNVPFNCRGLGSLSCRVTYFLFDILNQLLHLAMGQFINV